MTLKVQIRDSAGNVLGFVRCGEDLGLAMRTATNWIEEYPSVPIEIVREVPPDRWECRDCESLVYDLAVEECPLCGAGR